MKDFNWKIKISDFLSNPGKIEEIKLENKFLNGFDIVGKKGIYGKLTIRGLNDSELLVNINELKTTIKDSCDLCFDDYVYDIKVFNKEVIFIMEENRRNEGEIYDEEFIIDKKDETINLKELIYQLLTLSEPIVKNCGKHEDEDFEDDFENNISESGGNIMWK